MVGMAKLQLIGVERVEKRSPKLGRNGCSCLDWASCVEGGDGTTVMSIVKSTQGVIGGVDSQEPYSVYHRQPTIVPGADRTAKRHQTRAVGCSTVSENQ